MERSGKDKLKHLAKRPDTLFPVAAIAIILIPTIFWGESVVIDFVGLKLSIDSISIIYILGILMIVWWIIYRISDRYLFSDSLTLIHIIITIGVFAYFLLTGFWYLKSNADSDSQTYLFRQLMINRERQIRIVSVAGMIFVVGQLAFVANLIMGLTRKSRSN
jgi:positive regulator of sigma E activity